jgi:hypothetical protein
MRILTSIFVTISFIYGIANGDSKITAIDAINSLAGSYTGHWDMYDLGNNGQVKLSRSWDDQINLTNPQIGIDPFVNQQRAFGVVTNTITYTIPSGIPTITMQFTEGFKIQEDRTTGQHYFTFADRTGKVTETLENQIGPNLWQYESSVDLANYSTLGINNENIIYAKNLSVKSITVEGNIELQNVAQTTTLVWKDASGIIQSKQFVSMNGVHKRILQK